MSISPVRFWCQRVVPLVYDDSLSLYEQVCKLTQKLNDVIEQVNSITENDYIDQQIKQLRAYVDAQDAKMALSSKNYTDTKLSAMEQRLFMQIQTLTNIVNEMNETTKEWVMLQLDIFKDQIKNIPLPAVVNPLTGKLQSVQSTFNLFYDYMRCEALSALDYDNLFITAKDYDDKQISAREFDIYGRKILNIPSDIIRSPFDGTFTPLQTVINRLASLHQIGITASAFDALSWSAETYDNKQISAYDFDWLTVA